MDGEKKQKMNENDREKTSRNEAMVVVQDWKLWIEE